MSPSAPPVLHDAVDGGPALQDGAVRVDQRPWASGSKAAGAGVELSGRRLLVTKKPSPLIIMSVARPVALRGALA